MVSSLNVYTIGQLNHFPFLFLHLCVKLDSNYFIVNGAKFNTKTLIVLQYLKQIPKQLETHVDTLEICSIPPAWLVPRRHDRRTWVPGCHISSAGFSQRGFRKSLYKPPTLTMMSSSHELQNVRCDRVFRRNFRPFP